MTELICALTKEKDFLTYEYNYVCHNILKNNIIFHRKQWEVVYILQMLRLSDFVKKGAKGITFGSGKGADITCLANEGCVLTVTDLNIEEAKLQGWVDTNQHSSDISAFIDKRFDNQEYLKNITIDNDVDMNNIPEKYLNGTYDFATSCCSLEHIGSLEKGLLFILESIKCVHVGGIVVHTTEFNLDSLKEYYNGDTIDHPLIAVYRKQDIEWLKNKVEELGHKMYDIDYTCNTGLYDNYIDIPPYTQDPHLRLELTDGLLKFPITCIGIVIKRLH